MRGKFDFKVYSNRETNFSFHIFFQQLSFDLFWNHFQSCWALMTYFCGWYKVKKIFWSLLTKVNNLPFIRFLEFQQIDFASFLSYFETFGTQMGYFCHWFYVKNLFQGLCIQIDSFLLQHFLSSNCLIRLNFGVFLGHIWPFWGQDEVKISVLDCTHKDNFPFIMFLAV